MMIRQSKAINNLLRTVIKKEMRIKPLQGALEVRVDNDLIFSKKQSGRFRDYTQVIALLKGKIVIRWKR